MNLNLIRRLIKYPKFQGEKVVSVIILSRNKVKLVINNNLQNFSDQNILKTKGLKNYDVNSNFSLKIWFFEYTY